MFCSKCGNKVNENNKFCTRCGAPIAPPAPPASAEATIVKPEVIVTPEEVVKPEAVVTPEVIVRPEAVNNTEPKPAQQDPSFTPTVGAQYFSNNAYARRFGLNFRNRIASPSQQSTNPQFSPNPNYRPGNSSPNMIRENAEFHKMASPFTGYIISAITLLLSSLFKIMFELSVDEPISKFFIYITIAGCAFGVLMTVNYYLSINSHIDLNIWKPLALHAALILIGVPFFKWFVIGVLVFGVILMFDIFLNHAVLLRKLIVWFKYLMEAQKNAPKPMTRQFATNTNFKNIADDIREEDKGDGVSNLMHVNNDTDNSENIPTISRESISQSSAGWNGFN